MPQARGVVQKAAVPEQLDGKEDGRQRAVGGPAEPRTPVPSAAPKPAGMPSSGPATQPNAAPTKKEGTTSPPLKPADRVTAVEEDLQQKGLRPGGPLFHGGGDDVPCRRRCSPGPAQICQRDDGAAAGCHPDPGVGQILLHPVLREVERPCRAGRRPGAQPTASTATRSIISCSRGGASTVKRVGATPSCRGDPVGHSVRPSDRG